MEELRSFPLRVVLTVTTGRLLTELKDNQNNGIGDLYDILNHMTGDTLFLHQCRVQTRNASRGFCGGFPNWNRHSLAMPISTAGLSRRQHVHRRESGCGWLNSR